MVDWWFQFIMVFWILFPAYAANGLAPLAKGRRPIDFGKRWKDGKRILGEGKTFEGLILGVSLGTLVGVVETLLMPTFNAYASQWGVQMIPMSFFIGFMISLGALTGDIVASFIKRRVGMKRGEGAPLLDQIDFVVGAIIFSFFFTDISIWMILMMVIITPLVHRIVCIAAYHLKLKQVPW